MLEKNTMPRFNINNAFFFGSDFLRRMRYTFVLPFTLQKIELIFLKIVCEKVSEGIFPVFLGLKH